MYKLTNLGFGQTEPSSIIRLSDNAFIPLDPANSDFTQFKKDLADGAELQDSEGVVMTAEQVNQFIETLA
jgi:hypothetical protein